MKIVSLITARGGSKGIPNKNIIDVNGKPLISYSISASLGSNVDETWVSTDSDKIKMVSVECGSKVIDRPKHLADDISMPDDSLLHFASKKDFDILVFIQPTSPMIKSQYINDGIEMIKSGKAKKGDGKDVDHKDGNANNNSPSNLRVMSRYTNRSRNNNK